MTSGIRDLGATFGSKILVLVAGLGAQSCLAWMLKPAGRGSYAVCMIFAAVLSMVFVLGTDLAGRYFVASRRFTLSEGVVHILVCGAAGCVLAVGAGLVLLHLPLAFVSKAAPESFYLALVSIPTTLFSFTFMSLLVALRDFTWLAVFSTGNAVLLLALNVVLVGLIPWEVNGALLAIVVNGVVTMAASLVLFRRKYALTWARPTWRGISEMLHYGVRYYGGQISTRVNFQVGTIILAFLASKEEIGLFAIAASLTGQIMVIPDSLGDVLMPRMAGDVRGRPELAAQGSRVNSVVCGALLLVLVIFAEPIVMVLFSPAFLPMVPLIRILAVGLLFRAACKVFEYYLLMTDHPGISSAAVLAGVIVNLVVLWWLMPAIGLPGAAVAMSASFLVSSIILAAAFKRLSGLSQKEMWRYRRADWAVAADGLRRLRARLRRGPDEAAAGLPSEPVSESAAAPEERPPEA